jgi:hypothetical protein
MTQVTTASLAYVATQVCFFYCSDNLQLTRWQLRFALSSSSVFCRTDTLTDSERFYESVLDFLEHPDEQKEVCEPLNWWNWLVIVLLMGILRVDYLILGSKVFPSFVIREPAAPETSALAKLREKRAQGSEGAAQEV